MLFANTRYCWSYGRAEDRYRHYLIDLTPSWKYNITGEPRVHNSLSSLIAYYQQVSAVVYFLLQIHSSSIPLTPNGSAPLFPHSLRARAHSLRALLIYITVITAIFVSFAMPLYLLQWSILY